MPDLAIISAGVDDSGDDRRRRFSKPRRKMARVRAALTRAGVADRDIQTSNISLNPDYVYENNQPPRLTGYNASNQVSVRFRDIANAGEILDALVAEGANSINGPDADHRQARSGARRGAGQGDRCGPGARRPLRPLARDAGGPGGRGERKRRPITGPAADAGDDGRAEARPPTPRSIPASRSSRSISR